jgi:RNA polymerase sigma-70 factor (ECF subfamily)
VARDASLTVETVIATALQRWPGIQLDRDSVVAALDERGLAPTSPHAVDVTLVTALASGDPAALAAFDRELVPDIRGALVRFGRDDDFLAEALQRVRVKLLVGDPSPRIAEYRGRGRLAAWIQIVAIREALMLQRAGRRDQPSDDDLVHLAMTDPVLARTRQAHKDAFAAAFRAAFADLDERERTLLRLCFVENAGAEDLARLYNVHRVTAFRWLRDARARLLEATRARFAAAANIASTDVDSVMRSLATSLSVQW